MTQNRAERWLHRKYTSLTGERFRCHRGDFHLLYPDTSPQLERVQLYKIRLYSQASILVFDVIKLIHTYRINTAVCWAWFALLNPLSTPAALLLNKYHL